MNYATAPDARLQSAIRGTRRGRRAAAKGPGMAQNKITTLSVLPDFRLNVTYFKLVSIKTIGNDKNSPLKS